MGDYRLDFNPKVYKNQSCQPVDLGEDVVELLRLEELPWDSAGVGTEAVDAVVVVAALGTGRQAGTQEDGGGGHRQERRHRRRGNAHHGGRRCHEATVAPILLLATENIHQTKL